MQAPVEIVVIGEVALAAFAERLAPLLKLGDCVAVYGDLGAGKTTFARALIRALVDDQTLDVPSPTFALRQDYACGRAAIVHFDLYRISDPRDLDDIGFDEALAQSITLIEWPENAGSALPVARLEIVLTDADTPESRTMSLIWRGSGEKRDLKLLSSGAISTVGNSAPET